MTSGAGRRREDVRSFWFSGMTSRQGEADEVLSENEKGYPRQLACAVACPVAIPLSLTRMTQ